MISVGDFFLDKPSLKVCMVEIGYTSVIATLQVCRSAGLQRCDCVREYERVSDSL